MKRLHSLKNIHAFESFAKVKNQENTETGRLDPAAESKPLKNMYNRNHSAFKAMRSFKKFCFYLILFVVVFVLVMIYVFYKMLSNINEKIAHPDFRDFDSHYMDMFPGLEGMPHHWRKEFMMQHMGDRNDIIQDQSND